MLLSPNDAYFFYRKAMLFSTKKLQALDKYWSNNSSHPLHNQLHQMIEIVLIKRGELTLKQKRSELINSLERSFSISNPMGRFSANLIGLANKLLISDNFKGIQNQ